MELLVDPVLLLLHSGRCPAHIDFLSGGDAQLGQPHPFDVDSCVRISIQIGMAAIAFPAALLECEVRIQRSAYIASFAGWRPSVDFYNGSSCIAGYPFKDGYKLCKSKGG